MDTDARPVALVVTYFPDPGIFERLEWISHQGGRLLVVDNGSGADMQERLRVRLGKLGDELIANRENRGLAVALNQGMARAEELGRPWVLTFDQDSRPAEGMIAALQATAESGPHPERIALVGPRVVEERFPGQEQRFAVPTACGFRRVRCKDQDLRGVMQVITSGALTNVRHWRALGGFNESLFIEYVDYEYCLRAVCAGLELCVSAKAVLWHNLGMRRSREFLGREFLPTFHSSVRHYYMMRNRVWMWRHYAWRRPRWALFDLCGSAKSVLLALLFEPGRSDRLRRMACGFRDGACGRMGPMSR